MLKSEDKIEFQESGVWKYQMLNTRCGSQKTIQSLQSVQVHGLMFIVELEASQSCFSFFGRRTKTANFAFAHNSYHDMTRIVTTDDGKS